MEDDICDPVTESGDKLTISRKNKSGRPMKAGCLNMHKSDAMQTIPELLEIGRTNEREGNPEQEIKGLVNKRGI